MTFAEKIKKAIENRSEYAKDRMKDLPEYIEIVRDGGSLATDFEIKKLGDLTSFHIIETK